MVRPLLVANFPRIVGGGELGLLELASGLRARGVEPLIAVPGAGGLACDFDRRVLSESLPAAAVVLRSLSAEVDLVHTTGTRGLMAASMARQKKPVIWHVRVAAQDKIDPVLRRLPDVIIANSKATAARFPDHPAVRVIYNGIPAPVPAEKRLLEPSGRKRVGVIGRMTPEKGHLDLLPVLEMLLKSRGDVDVVFAGDDSGSIGDVVRLAAARSDGRIALLGYRADIASHLREFDLVVVPSRIEGFGRVAAEALRAGVTVAATRVGGLPEVLEGVEDLLLPDDQDLWAEKISTLIDRPPYPPDRLQSAGARFDLDRHVDAVLDLYREISGK